MLNAQVAANKAKRQENTRQIFRKNEDFVLVCVSGGKKCSFFGEIWRAFFLVTHLEFHPFALLPMSMPRSDNQLKKILQIVLPN